MALKMVNTNMKSNEEQEVLAIITSCLTSSKESLSIEQLSRDYYQLVGSQIPFRSFHHATLASFLQSFPKEIKVFNRGGQLYVKAQFPDENSHIETLVHGQKKSKARGTFSRPNKMIRRPRSLALAPSPFPRKNSFNAGAYRPPHLRSPMNFRGRGKEITSNQVKIGQPKKYSVNGNHYVPRPHVNQMEMATSLTRQHVNQMEMAPPPLQMPVQPLSPPPGTLKSQVLQICHSKGIKVFYNTLPIGKRSTRFISTVNVNGQIFNTYPVELKTESEAEDLVSTKVLEHYKWSLQASPQPETKSFDKTKERIIEILNKDSQNPLWWDYICKCYSKEFHEDIPSNWINEAQKQSVSEIDFQPGPNNMWILSLKKDGPAPVKSAHESSPSSFQSNGISGPDPLKLPEDNMWSIFVSYIKDCTEIWFRLIEDEISSAYENLVTDMELYYMEENNRKQAVNPVTDSYYICYHEDSWFRVRLSNLSENKATVFFIDHGDTEEVPVSNLYLLESKFLQFPCQSISASLSGFDYGFSDPKIVSSLQILALGKTLIAEVLSREENLTVVLYDTTTNEDININEEVLQMLPKIYPTPNFPNKEGICEAYVSYVKPNGDIFVKIETASFTVLENLFQTAKKRAEEILGIEALDIDMGKLYIAKFGPEGEWCKAAPRSVSQEKDGKVLLKALDYDMQERIPAAQIIPLENVSKMLAKIPPQCLPCRLHNTPSTLGLQWSQKASERLISLLPPRNQPLLLKVIREEKDNKLTEVELYKRTEPNNDLISVNATLDFDKSVFRKEDKNNNCNDLESSTSPLDSKDMAMLSFETVDTQKNMNCLNDIKYPPLPVIRSYFDVLVTYAANPSNFAVQSWKDSMKLKWLMDEMKSYYSKSSTIKRTGEIKQGVNYAYKHTDNSWYRVRIDKVMNDFVSGIFIDYGDCFCSNEELSYSVQELLENFKHLPFQAFKAQLAGVIPTNKDWTPEDCLRFRDLVENRPFVSIVTNIAECSSGSQSDSPILSLRLIDTSDPKVDVYIDEILINENRAVKTNSA